MIRSVCRCLPVLVPLLWLAAPAAAQMMGGPPSALQGFSVNRELPVQITSTTLEVRDKEKRATFIGNVIVAQGDTTMKSKTLDVFYDQEADPNAPPAPAASPAPTGGPGGNAQIRRLEAKGGVVVTQKDQIATGETGIFDMKANTVTLLGGIVITQGPQVIRGERLTVDLTSGVSHIEGGARGVQGLFHPNRPKPGESKSGDGNGKPEERETRPADARPSDARPSDARPEPARKGAVKPSARSTPGEPMRLN